jgi:hypothetical protein
MLVSVNGVKKSPPKADCTMKEQYSFGSPAAFSRGALSWFMGAAE